MPSVHGVDLYLWNFAVRLMLCLRCLCYTTDYLTFSDLLDKADSDLFCNMRRSDHCLHPVLSPLRMVDNLRVRGHPYNLPECSTNVHKKPFVVRSLYGFT